jgi:hypothetical protein
VDESGEELLRVVDGEQEQLFNLITCGEYLDMADDACGAVRLSALVSTFELTTCCAFLHAMHARGCLCPPAGFFRLNHVNPDLQVIAPAACALRLDWPPPLGLSSCKTKLTLEQVMSPAVTIAQGETTSGTTSSGDTLESLAGVAEEATPLLVTTATTVTVTEGSGDDKGGNTGGNVTTQSVHEVPLGSVIGVISKEDFAELLADGDIQEILSVDPFAVLQPGMTCRGATHQAAFS